MNYLEHSGVKGMKWGVRRRLSDSAKRRIRNIAIGAVGAGALAGAGYLAYKKGVFGKKAISTINNHNLLPVKNPTPALKAPSPIVSTHKPPTIKPSILKTSKLKPPKLKPQQYDYEAYRRSIVSRDMKAFHDTYDEYKRAVEQLRSTAEKLNPKPVKKKRLRNIAKHIFK